MLLATALSTYANFIFSVCSSYLYMSISTFCYRFLWLIDWGSYLYGDVFCFIHLFVCCFPPINIPLLRPCLFMAGEICWDEGLEQHKTKWWSNEHRVSQCINPSSHRNNSTRIFDCRDKESSYIDGLTPATPIEITPESTLVLMSGYKVLEIIFFCLVGVSSLVSPIISNIDCSICSLFFFICLLLFISSVLSSNNSSLLAGVEVKPSSDNVW